MKPRAESWPPDYVAEYRKRQAMLVKTIMTPRNIAAAKIFYKNNSVAFIEDWCITVDPRNAALKRPTKVPFVLFPRQREFIHWLDDCVVNEVNGICEKSRDMGATWLCVAYSVWLWLFRPGAAVGWGSRKAELVDRIGDMSSIFEKIRALILNVPPIFLPAGFNPQQHMGYMKIVSPDGATITGESGDSIGRGGRTLIYFKDEAAHYERPELIEASLADTTRVQIDISSVNGLGNVFHRKREAAVEWRAGATLAKDKPHLFVLDWRDHPAKTQDWYDTRRRAAKDMGLLHVFAQEVDRDYAAAIENVIIPPEWVKAAIDAHLVLEWDNGQTLEDGEWGAALDVADEGGDRNAIAIRKGNVLRDLREWADRDTGVTTRSTIQWVEAHAKRCTIQYDSIGIGAGVKGEVNRLLDEDAMPKGLKFVPWNAAASPLDPDAYVEDGDNDSPLNKDFYYNLKAQGWWQLRRRFEKTYRAVKEGIPFAPEELISIDSSIPMLHSLEKELSQPTAGRSPAKLKLVVNKKPEGTRSPNLADAVMMAFWPVDVHGYDSSLDWVGGDDGLPVQALLPMRRFA
jgi:phage terminase large subunit